MASPWDSWGSWGGGSSSDTDGDGYGEWGSENKSSSSSDSTWWDALTNLGSEAKDLLRNPETYIIGVVVSWVLGGILDFVEGVFAMILRAFELVAGIPATIGGAFGAAGAVITSTVFGALGTITDMVVNLVTALGWTAPLVAGLVFLAVMEATEEFGPAAGLALSDLLGAIPVVGSVLDALLTFVIKLAMRVTGGNS